MVPMKVAGLIQERGAIAVGTTNKGKPAYFYENMVGVLVGLEGALPLTSLW